MWHGNATGRRNKTNGGHFEGSACPDGSVLTGIADSPLELRYDVTPETRFCYMDPLLGDFDFSGVVDFPDFLILAANYGTSIEEGGIVYNWGGDMDNDGDRDFEDFLAFAQVYGDSRPAQARALAHSIPEPASLLPVLLGLVTLSAFRKSWGVKSTPVNDDNWSGE